MDFIKFFLGKIIVNFLNFKINIKDFICKGYFFYFEIIFFVNFYFYFMVEFFDIEY